MAALVPSPSDVSKLRAQFEIAKSDVARWQEAAADLGRCFDSANKRIAELERELREARKPSCQS